MKDGKKSVMRVLVFEVALTIFIIASPRVSSAEVEFGFQPRIIAGLMDYTLDVKASEAIFGTDWKFSDNMPYLGVGSTFFLDRFYLDAYYQFSAQGTTSLSKGAWLPADPQQGRPSDGDITMFGDAEFDNWNLSFTLGYQVLDTLALYAGYKHTETSFEFDTFAYLNMVDDGSITGTPGFPLTVSLKGNFDIDYEGKGPFVGGTYGFVLGDAGVLGLNVAVAFLDGEIEQSGGYVNTSTGLPDDTFNIGTKGDSIGISYSVAWRSKITDTIGYSLAINGLNYDFDADKSDQSDFEETVYSFCFGLSYAF